MNLKNIIKAGLDAEGATEYLFLTPIIEELIRDTVERKTRELEEDVKEMITDALIKRADKRHRAMKKNKLNPSPQQQKELNYESQP